MGLVKQNRLVCLARHRAVGAVAFAVCVSVVFISPPPRALDLTGVGDFLLAATRKARVASGV
jgi:hypothetical protein